jgi:hypothetical protein
MKNLILALAIALGLSGSFIIAATVAIAQNAN